MRTRKFPALIALLVAFAAITTGGASAADPGGTPKSDTTTWDLTATSLDLTNTRTITALAVTPGASGLTSLQSALSVSVTEAQAISDGNSWSLGVSLDDFAEHDGTSFVTNGKTLACENVSMAPADPGGLLTLATSLTGVQQTYGSSGSFSRDTGTAPARDCLARTLFTVSGQQLNVAYSNVYTGAATMTASTPSTGLLDTNIIYRTTVEVTLVE